MSEPLFTAGLALLGILVVAVFSLLRRSDRSRLESLKGERDRLLARFSDSEKQCAGLQVRADAAERDYAGLRALLDALPIPVWRRRTEDLKLIAVNRAYAAAVDAEPSRALDQGLELAGGDGRNLAQRARDQGSLQREKRHVVVEGARRLLELSEVPLAEGELVGFAGDLTEAESLRDELARHTAAHAAVLENVAAAIAIYGADMRLAFFNAAFAQLWQLEPDWLASSPTMDEILERLREKRRIPEHADFRAFKKQQRALFTSLIHPQEELLHLPDERALRLTVSPHPMGGLTFVYEDVTDRLALERSYNALIAAQRETLDNLYEGIAVVGSDARVKLWNPAFARLWRLAPEDLAGEPHIADIVEKCRALSAETGPWPETKRRIVAALTAHAGSSTLLERADGSRLQAATVPLPDGNILLSYLDVTDSIRVEQALRERTEALETAGRLKSEFIANVSYELRTPLNAIGGFAEILANQYFGELNPRQMEYSRGILDSAQRLSSLINDILDLATIEAGYLQLETQPVEIHALMSALMTLSHERARNQGIALAFDCPVDIGSMVADERRLKQALFNLVSNAIKFTPAGGTITLRARREKGGVALAISDTGIGVAQQDQARIFEKFERGQGREGGAGLGLSLVKSLVDLHGGKIELKSAPGSGTTVTIHIPNAAETLRQAGE
jgi:signal transduction histidine kinase